MKRSVSEPAAERRGRGRSARLVAIGVMALLLVLLGAAGAVWLLGSLEVDPSSVEQGRYLVVDVRSADAFSAGHLPSSAWLPFERLEEAIAVGALPNDRPVLLVCDHGRLSLVAAAVATSSGHRAASLAGGMARWRKEGRPLEHNAAWPSLVGDAAAAWPPRLEAGLPQQLAVVLTAFGAKPAYMALSLVLIVILARSRARDLRLLLGGLVAFLLGETLCAVNYVFFGGRSDLLEVGHGFGMVAMGALLAWGLFAFLDDRVLQLTGAERPCAAVRLCRRCWKREPAACGAHRMFLLLAPALAVVALLPFTMPLRPLHAVMPVLGSDVRYAVSIPLQLVELRLYPALAFLMFGLTTALLLRGLHGVRQAQAPLFAGVGLISFALFRLVLLEVFRVAPGWKDAWEELTELLMVVAIALLLWLFREQLGLRRRPV